MRYCAGRFAKRVISKPASGMLVRPVATSSAIVAPVAGTALPYEEAKRQAIEVFQRKYVENLLIEPERRARARQNCGKRFSRSMSSACVASRATCRGRIF